MSPEFGTTVATGYPNGMATLGERILMVINCQKQMLTSEMAPVDAVGTGIGA